MDLGLFGGGFGCFKGTKGFRLVGVEAFRVDEYEAQSWALQCVVSLTPTFAGLSKLPELLQPSIPGRPQGTAAPSPPAVGSRDVP